MKVDLSKYKCFDCTTKTETVLNLRSTCEPFSTKSPKNYCFYYDKIHFITKNYLSYTSKVAKSELVTFKHYTKREKEYIIDFPEDLYIEKGKFNIPYEYYSRAYIDFFDIEIFENKVNLNLVANPITFKLDPVGRLHICKECLASYIYCMEKQIPVIKCEITLGGNITSEEQYDLAKKYLEPYFLLSKKNSLFEFFVKPNSIAEKYLKSIEKDRLDFYLPCFTKYTDVTHGIAESLTGYIFFDGSFVFFDGSELYHCLFQRILLDIDQRNEVWEEVNGIKLDTLHYVNNKVLVLYNKDLITLEAKRTLHKLSKYYDMDIQPYESRETYNKKIKLDDNYKRRNTQ